MSMVPARQWMTAGVSTAAKQQILIEGPSDFLTVGDIVVLPIETARLRHMIVRWSSAA
jgi:hypothetical protein